MDIKIPFIYAPPVANQVKTVSRRVSERAGQFKNSMQVQHNENAPQAFHINSCLDLSTMEAIFNNIQDEQKQKSLNWSRMALEQLEIIRIGLIAGLLSKKTLSDLKTLTNQTRGFVADPKLQEIMREIETRAKVELAKMEKVEK